MIAPPEMCVQGWGRCRLPIVGYRASCAAAPCPGASATQRAGQGGLVTVLLPPGALCCHDKTLPAPLVAAAGHNFMPLLAWQGAPHYDGKAGTGLPVAVVVAPSLPTAPHPPIPGPTLWPTNPWGKQNKAGSPKLCILPHPSQAPLSFTPVVPPSRG